MRKTAYLPVGTQTQHETLKITEGDILQLFSGERMTFIEMKRTKFHAKYNGGITVVPVWRNSSTPFIKAIVGHDESVVTQAANIDNFKHGQLFALEGQKETFMFIGRKPTGKVIGLDLASKKKFNIDTSFKFVEINIDELVNEF